MLHLLFEGAETGEDVRYTKTFYPARHTAFCYRLAYRAAEPAYDKRVLNGYEPAGLGGSTEQKL